MGLDSQAAGGAGGVEQGCAAVHRDEIPHLLMGQSRGLVAHCRLLASSWAEPCCSTGT